MIKKKKVGLGEGGRSTAAFCGGLSTTTAPPQSVLFFLHDGMESIRESSRNATRCRAKTFKCSQTTLPCHIPPWGALMDKRDSGSSAVSLDVYFLPHACPCASVFYASAALWLWGLGDRLYMSIMSFHVYHGDWSTSCVSPYCLLPNM